MQTLKQLNQEKELTNSSQLFLAFYNNDHGAFRMFLKRNPEKVNDIVQGNSLLGLAIKMGKFKFAKEILHFSQTNLSIGDTNILIESAKAN